MTLGERLLQLRKKNYYTQQMLGQKLNISAQAISKWENDLSEPDLAMLRKLAELYEISLYDLSDPDQIP